MADEKNQKENTPSRRSNADKDQQKEQSTSSASEQSKTTATPEMEAAVSTAVEAIQGATSAQAYAERSSTPVEERAPEGSLAAAGGTNASANPFDNVNNAQSATFMPNYASMGAPTASVPAFTPKPITVGQMPEVQEKVENIVAKGGTEFKLDTPPMRIDSVRVNGQEFNLGIVGQDLHTAANQVLYDAEKGALVFLQDIQGIIQVVYQHAPEVEQGITGGLIAWLHKRVADLEAIVGRLQGSRYV